MISIKNLHKYYNKGKQNEIHVINDISLELPEKGLVALFGKSGSGKTTLLNAVGGLTGTSQGTIEIDGKSFQGNKNLIRNKYIGYIFQNYYLNEKQRVFDNVADSLRLVGITDEEEINNRVMNALKNVDMEKFYNRKPGTLSGGQQQRIAIARAIVKNPAIILADEPTGNLDENNTLMVMDLLKEISKEHLVLLVTHEANLVDGYCDKIIELKDGKIISQRDNEDANGLNLRNKNHIYLGDMEKEATTTTYGEIEYYGDKPKDSLKIQVINYNGMMYLKLDNYKAQVVDGSSEIKVLEGKFQQKATDENRKKFYIEPLENINEKKAGRLFHFWNSYKQGLKDISGAKKSNKRFRKAMGMLAFIAVMITGFYGYGLRVIKDAKEANNPNVFYLKIDNEAEALALIKDSNDLSTGIESFYFTADQTTNMDDEFEFRSPEFEDSLDMMWTSTGGITSFHAAKLIENPSDKAKFVAGTGISNDNEIVITTKVADQILKKDSYEYINDYDSLIGFSCRDYGSGGYGYYYYYEDYYEDYYYNASPNKDNGKTIVGIVESDESVVYYSESSIAKDRIESELDVEIGKATDYGYDLSEGEMIIVDENNESNAELAKNPVTILGNEFKVKSIEKYEYSYEQWLADNNIKLVSFENYEAQEPEYKRVEYLEYYYSKVGLYARDCVKNGNIKATDCNVLAIYYGTLQERTCAIAKMEDFEDYYYAKMFEADNMRYPTKEELEQVKALNTFDIVYDQVVRAYSDGSYGGYVYVLSDNDYEKLATSYGETSGYKFKDAVSSVNNSAVIHTNDYEKTEAYLKKLVSSTTTKTFQNLVVTPQQLVDKYLEDNSSGNSVLFVIGIILMSLMCLFIYLIMNSEIMSKIKEIGMYRCIGVSNKNIIFNFACKILAICTRSCFVGFALGSGVMLWMSTGNTASIYEAVFYYPVWMAALLLIGLTAATLGFGLIPVIGILTKSPSDIMAKYDV